ncbi:M91 family zinc metallopeptidase [Pseudomonas poae]|nr:M91 family zinc metallopeptidase [Pseudomonas poae]
MYFTPDSKLTNDQDPTQKNQKKYINTDMLRHDQNVKIYQEITYISDLTDLIASPNNEFILETGNANDKIVIKKAPDDTVIAVVNNKPYQLNLSTPSGEVLPLRIKTNGGNDCVLIEPDVYNDVTVQLGDGDDYARAGSGKTKLHGGAGSDTLKLGSGDGVAFGGDGNDLIIAGTGTGVLKGNNGNDRMQAGAGSKDRRLFMDGGEGDDFMIVTKNTSNNAAIIHGGLGRNLLVANGASTIYTGRDNNIVRSNSDDTVIYAKPTDQVHRTSGSTLTNTLYKEAGHSGFEVEGSSEFKQNVSDDMEFLRISPQGQKMLVAADAAAERNDAPTRITEFTEENGEYHFITGKLQKYFSTQDSAEVITPSDFGVIVQNRPGSRATAGEVRYNPSFSLNNSTPINVLHHEMAHAYNGANGTFLDGSTAVAGTSYEERNNERQVIGLPTPTQPFDFDNHPSTEPTTHNPEPLTENALREEMRIPKRETHIS